MNQLYFVSYIIRKDGNTIIEVPSVNGLDHRRVVKAPGDGISGMQVQLDHWELRSTEWLQEQIDLGHVWKYPSGIPLF